MKKAFTARKFLCILLIVCLISMIGTCLVQNGFGSIKVKTHYTTLTGLANEIRSNNEKYGKDVQVTFTESAQARISFMTLIPKNASETNPLPAVILSHGFANSKEIFLPQYIELSRRGFVVISMDDSSHAYTDDDVLGLTADSYGMLAIAEYAMSLPFVDKDNIGVSGHSMGNSSCFATINALNTADSTQRIAAWVEGAGTMMAPNMTSDLLEGMVWTVSVDKYDEFDSVYFDAAHFMTGDLAKQLIKLAYPAFSDNEVPSDKYFTEEGPVDQPANGAALAADTAVRINHTPTTHPGFHFSKVGAAIEVDGMYAAFGVPSGASYIPSSRQIWPIAVCFELIGLIAFFLLMFPLVDLLGETKLFAGVKRKVREGDQLPSIKEPKEIVSLVIVLLASILFSYFSFIKLYPLGERLVDTTIFPSSSVSNSVGLWTFVCGLFAIGMIIAGYAIKALMTKKDERDSLGNPFAPAIVDSVSMMLKTLLFALTVIAIMLIPVYIARYVFNADFRICSFAMMATRLGKLPIIVTRYMPLWFLFYVPNAIMNANTRYKDAPEWLTTLICALSNCIALVIITWVQYATLLKTGSLWNPNLGMACIVAFAIIPCLFFAGYSARVIYKKTGNAWLAGFINGALMTCITTFSTSMYTNAILG